MLSITKSDYLHEYEIKISKADFNADFNKITKHAALDNKKEIILEVKDKRNRNLLSNPKNIIKDESGNVCYQYIITELVKPAYFWYVTPIDLVTMDDIPSYAGWMVINDQNRVFVKKSAPRHQTEKVSSKDKIKILESMSHRYWQLRLKQ